MSCLPNLAADRVAFSIRKAIDIVLSSGDSDRYYLLERLLGSA